MCQTIFVETGPNRPQRHEDRKAQKLLDRIDKKLQTKGTRQGLPQIGLPETGS